MHRRFHLTAFGAVVVLTLAACSSGGGASAAASTAPTSAPSAAMSEAPSASAEASAMASAPASPSTSATISIKTTPLGDIVVDSQGRTLYAFEKDSGGKPTCYGGCAAAWPPVLTRGAPGRAGRLPGALGTTRRRDGARQVTYDGHPLYYYTGDVSPGQILCQNVNEFGGTWLVVSPSGKPVR